jgi:hypothetical protein
MNAPAPAPSLLDRFLPGDVMRSDISNADYHADRSCVSVSGLKQLLRSPAHFQAYLDGARDETPALFFGRAIHTRVLEPEAFATDYVVAPVSDRRIKEYKDFALQHADKQILTPEQAVQLEGLAERIAQHTSAQTLIRAGLKEHTLVAQDEETGIWLKVRPDNLCLDFGVCLDLKSCEDASAPAFVRSCVSYDYDLQAAVYRRVLRERLGTDFDFAFLAFEKDDPYGVALYGAPPEMIARGERRMRQALDTLARARETGCWPAYQPDGGYALLDWPRWAS